MPVAIAHEGGKTFSGLYAHAFAATEWLSVGAYADVVSGNTMPTSAIQTFERPNVTVPIWMLCVACLRQPRPDPQQRR